MSFYTDHPFQLNDRVSKKSLITKANGEQTEENKQNWI